MADGGLDLFYGYDDPWSLSPELKRFGEIPTIAAPAKARKKAAAKAPTKLSKMLGPISAGLNLVSGIMGYEQMRGMAAGYRAQEKHLLAQAEQVMRQGYETSRDVRREGEEFLGTMTAIFGKSGTLFEGSPMLVELDVKRKIERNVERIIEQARIQRDALRYEAKQARRASRSAKKAGLAQLTQGALGAVSALRD